MGNKVIAKIAVVGVGGAGCNAAAYMANKIKFVDFYGVNTDLQALDSKRDQLESLIQIGEETTKGLGAGADPEKGRLSALENEEHIKTILKDYNMVFIAAGMGGGTGTGAAPVIASICKELNILTVAVVTTPFKNEFRDKVAKGGIEELRKYTDSILIVPNNKLIKNLGEINMRDAFIQSDEVLRKSVQGISDIITTSGFVNVDFADVRRVLSNSGNAIIGTGRASGSDRAKKATIDALDYSFLDVNDIKNAKGILINVAGNYDLSLPEFEMVGSLVSEIAHKDAVIISGMSYSNDEDDEESKDIYITVVATNFEESLIQEEDKKEVKNNGFEFDLNFVNLINTPKTESKVLVKKEENNSNVKGEKISESEKNILRASALFSDDVKESKVESKVEVKEEKSEFKMPSFLSIN